MIPEEQIKKLLFFTVPRIKELRYLETPFDIVLFCFEVMDDWDRYRKDEEVVDLFYDTLDHMNIKIPNSPREQVLDLKLFLRIWSLNHSKSFSFVQLALQLGINKDTLKKILGNLDPELSLKLRNRKKLTEFEHYKIAEILGVYEASEFDNDEAQIFEKSKFIRRSDMYKHLNTDKKTLESNLSESLKQKISGLDRIPPVLYKEIRDQLNGTLSAAS